ncbi:phage tail protein [Lysinibacillus sp. LZ02]|uniref:phage tail protein n=1 Tax=Lysinibacillus sp. LZ02 TaxID=3420668 RepID=UPI003D36BFE9
MAEKIIEEFDATRITNFAIKFKGDEQASSFGCVGKIEGSSESVAIVKKCEAVEKKRKSKVQKMVLTLSAHVKVATLRRIFGIKNNGLKPGVYRYGTDSIGEDFTLTATAIDEFEDEQKLIAFSNCANNTGFKITVENGVEEVAELELEYTALPDVSNGIYYEAYLAELDEVTKEQFVSDWHSNFTPELVKAIDEV